MQLLRIIVGIALISSTEVTARQSHSYSQQSTYQRQSSQTNPQPGQPPQPQQYAPQGKGQSPSSAQLQQLLQTLQQRHPQQQGAPPQAQMPPSNSQQYGQRPAAPPGGPPQLGQPQPQPQQSGFYQGPQESGMRIQQPVGDDQSLGDAEDGGGGGAPQSPPQAAAPPQELIDGINQLSEEIVEAVVERLEEDEAMAIELEKQGFDPDAYSSHRQLLKPTFSICVILVLVLLFEIY